MLWRIDCVRTVFANSVSLNKAEALRYFPIAFYLEFNVKILSFKPGELILLRLWSPCSYARQDTREVSSWEPAAESRN